MTNKSRILKAMEWVDRTAGEGDVRLLERAKEALAEELAHAGKGGSSEEAYSAAVESFVRKYGREPLEDVADDDEAIM